MPYLTMGDLGAAVDPGVWDNIASAVTNAMTGEGKPYAEVSTAEVSALVAPGSGTEYLTPEAAAAAAEAAAAAAAKKKWLVILLAGGAVVAGYMIWRRRKNKGRVLTRKAR
jgi:hypothetical protein